MAKFYTGMATIDKYLEIKKGDDNFYKFIGDDNFFSLAKSAHPDDLLKIKSALEVLEQSGYSMITYRIMRADGKYRWILAEFEYSDMDISGEPLINVNIQDINALEREMKKIKDDNSIINEYIGLLDELLFEYDIEQDIFRVFIGGKSQNIDMVNLPIEEWRREVIEKEYIDEEYIDEFETLVNDIKKGVRIFQHEIVSSQFSLNDTSELHLVKGKTILNSSRERKVIGYISSINPENKKKEHNFILEANKDHATDLLNKRAITEYARKAVETCDEKEEVYLCIIDLDNFKNINDTFGHMFGDEVLAVVANIIKEAIGEKGVAGRIGGDEMMAVIDKAQSKNEIRGILRSIRSNVEWYYKGKVEGVNLSTSIGVSEYPANSSNYEELFTIADKMLYLAKKKGKNRYIIYTPEIHGDVLNNNVVDSDHSNLVQSKVLSKEKMVMSTIDEFLYKASITYETFFDNLTKSFALDGVEVFFENLERPSLGWVIDENTGKGRLIDVSSESTEIDRYKIDYVFNPRFQALFDTNDVAVVDHVEYLSNVISNAYMYYNDRGITSVLVYRFCQENVAGRQGYMVFYRKSSSARKWDNDERAYLTFIGKSFELAITSR